MKYRLDMALSDLGVLYTQKPKKLKISIIYYCIFISIEVCEEIEARQNQPVKRYIIIDNLFLKKRLG
jgi:hypothetical protein